MFYQEIATKVPSEKINNFIKIHGFQPLDPSKVGVKDVAKSLKYIVEIHGVEAYQELQKLLESSTTKELASPSSKSSCGCDCKGCSKSKMHNVEGDLVEDKSDISKTTATTTTASDFMKKNSQLIIIGATIVIVALLLKNK